MDNYQCLISLCLLMWFTNIDAVEEPAPEVLLQPRNFNPHPYELGYDPISGGRQEKRLREYANRIDALTEEHRRGPVLFPPNANELPQQGVLHPGDGGYDNRLDIDTSYLLARLKDTHPYAGVAAKQKKKYGLGLGRFASEPEHINPQVYNALAAHGAKVLNVPEAKDLKNVPNLQRIEYNYDDESKKNYAFSYKVVDHLTGDDFSHSQSQNSHATNGEYRVKLPDGRVQIVSYTADKNGYKADVKYAGGKHAESHHTPSAATSAPPTSAPVHVPLYADSILHTNGAASVHVNGDAADNFINQELIARALPADATYYDDHHQQHQHQQLRRPHHHQLHGFDQQRPSAIVGGVGGGGGGGRVVLILPGSSRLSHKQQQQHGKFIAPTYVETLSTLAPDLDHFNPAYIDANK